MRFIIIIILGWTPVLAQVDQNFEVNPQNSNCEDLPEGFSKMDSAVNILESTKFRIEESIRTSRVSGIQNILFRSCNGSTGYLILEIDNTKIAYRNIPLEVWREYLTTRDLEGFYEDRVKNKFQRVTDPKPN